MNHGDDGWTRTSYQYKNYGRGPEQTGEFKLAADASIQDYKVQGTSTFGSLVQETFVRRGTRAHWKSTADSGDLEI